MIQSSIVDYIIDSSNTKGRISPLLFGHNLEHTRSCIWQGLSSEMLQNRKFFGKPKRNGVALDWNAIGPRQTYFAVETENAYTRRYSNTTWHRRNEIGCQRIRNINEGEVSGIWQGDLWLQANRQYNIRLVLRSDPQITVRVRIFEQESAQIIYESSCSLISDGWSEYKFAFEVLQRSSEARFEITTDQKANLYIGAVSLMPVDNFLGMRTDVIALLKEMGCSLLRWPGGNFAGDYRWQDGLLPVDQRAPLASNMEMETLPHTRGFDCHEIGIDEFIELCHVVGAEPFLTINPAWEEPELAAAWVEYCNGSIETQWGGLRATRGHSQPYNVKYWSLGNELGYGHMEGPNTASVYAKKIRPYADAMRAIDPSIELVSSGIWVDYHNLSSESWFTDCLADLGDVLHHISHHHYTGLNSYMGMFAGSDDSTTYQKLVTAPTEIVQKELAQLRNKVNAYTPADCKIGISFDEWNVWYAWYRIPSVIEGIYNASMLNMLFREADQLGVTISCFFEPVNEGAILVDVDKAYLSAGGKVYLLFKAHINNILLNLGSQSGKADVDATASLNEETENVVVTLVNRSPHEGHMVCLKNVDGAFKEPEGIILSSPNFLPASDFSQIALTFSKSERDLEFVLPKNSVARIVARV